MPFCDTCDHHCYDLDLHACPPIWLILHEDLGDDWEDAEKVRDDEATDAAARWMEEYERQSCEFQVASGETAEVLVRKAPDGPILKIAVTGEVVPHYRAREVTGE